MFFGVSIVVRYLRNPNPMITTKLLRLFGANIGKKTIFKRGLYIDNSYEDKNSSGDFRFIKIGKNCYIGDNVYFDLSNEVILEDNVVVSGYVSFITHSDCGRSQFLDNFFPRKCQSIKIESDTWIGFKSTILSGVTIRKKTVIAANSLVQMDLESEALYGGIPAQKIKDINVESKP
jgi:acetyltransferase-like isoleucine patch superfamily enzyme